MGANDQRAAPSATGSGSGVGWFDTTCQCAGAVTVSRYVLFRSGCSNTANIRRASGTANCVYRYASPSTGSTKRCRPCPVFT